jgi:H+-transporting ATPase
VVTGKFIVSTFDMVLLLFLVDFVTLSLATDRAKGSPKPTTWNIDHLVKAGFPLGIASVLEALGLLWLGWGRLHLAEDIQVLHTFSFGILFYFGMFTVLAVRERGAFWTSRPSGPLLAAILADMALTAVLMTRGMPGLSPIPWTDVFFIVFYAFAFGLLVNDFLKVSLLSRTSTRVSGV